MKNSNTYGKFIFRYLKRTERLKNRKLFDIKATFFQNLARKDLLSNILRSLLQWAYYIFKPALSALLVFEETKIKDAIVVYACVVCISRESGIWMESNLDDRLMSVCSLSWKRLWFVCGRLRCGCDIDHRTLWWFSSWLVFLRCLVIY